MICSTIRAIAVTAAIVVPAAVTHAADAPPSLPSQPYQWRNVAIIAGGFVDGLIFSPAKEGLAFARTDIGGAYRWDKASRKWIPLNDWAGGKDGNLLGCESVGVDPIDPKRFYLALGTYTGSWSSNGAIVGTADGGRTWHRTDVPFKMGGNESGRATGERLAVDPNRNSILYMGSRNDGLWKSADYGGTWSKVNTFPITGRTNGIGTTFVLFDRTSGRKGSPSKTLYAGVSQDGPGLYRSDDAGVTWTPVPGQPTGLMPYHGVLADDGALTITYGNSPGRFGMSKGAVWRLDTHAGDWQDITPPSKGGDFAGLALDPRHPRTIMVSTTERWNPGDTLFRTTDGGAHWTDLGPASVRDWSISPYMTFGDAAPKLGWWIGAMAVDPFHPGHVMYGTGATIWASDDVTEADAGKPTHWTIGASGIEETATICLISPPAGPHLISGLGDIGGFRHDDLTVSPRQGMWKPKSNNTNSLDFAENKPGVVVRVGTGGPGACSEDGGATWTAFKTAPVDRAEAGRVAVAADGSAIIWALWGGRAFVTRDRGATWTACAGLPDGRTTVIADRANAGTFYAIAGSQLYASADGGTTFSIRGALPEKTEEVYATPGRSGDLWATAGASGLYHSSDGGVTFKHVGDLPNADRLGFGKNAPGRDYPALYVTGQTASGASGVFRSDDIGQRWVRINDDAHQFGYSGQFVTGDPRIYGRVYMGSNGRGVFYADPVASVAAK